MSSKYEKSYVHEEEGTYHRREIEPIAPRDEKNYTTHHETSYTIVPKQSSKTPIKSSSNIDRHRAIGDTSDDENNYEEWTTSKRKVNHKTRQVETRVSRQLLVEDGKVIADSGPQVTTRIKEDNKVEECEKEKAPKNKSKFDAISCAPEAGESSGRVLGEKKEIQRVSREVREENMQYHDERFKELTGHDVHRKAIQAPHELITITDKSHHHASAPRGKMVHYSNKGKIYQDTDEILEVAKLAIDGSITKEVKRTKHHEECSEDELPDEKGEAEALREKPILTRSSRRHVDYVNDFDDTATPSSSSGDEVEGDQHAIRKYKAQKSKQSRPITTTSSSLGKQQHRTSGSSSRHNNQDDEAFPRYKIDPLLNSLRDEDFRPINSSSTHRQDRHSSAGSRHKEVPLMRRDKQDSSDYEATGNRFQQRQRSPSPYRSVERVEIPEEYRVNRQRLQASREQQPRERSFSPAQTNRSVLHKTNTGGNSRRHHLSRDQDASVQAHLTDEELERKSISGSSTNSHEKQARHLQRQSTTNSSRNYYYGKPKHQQRQRAPSVTSSSSLSSLNDNLKDKQRKKGVKSRDSGFRSPNHHIRAETPLSNSTAGQQQQQQIYSVSSKAKKHHQQQRPTSPTGSLGQRSVKTTTTTMSAGLQDRPRSRQEGERRSPVKGGEKTTNKSSPSSTREKSTRQLTDEECRSFDTISLASLGPNVTTIRVPYRGDQVNMMEEDAESNSRRRERRRRESRGKGEIIEEQHKQRRRLISGESSSSSRTSISIKTNEPKQQFNYRTIIANVQPVPNVPKQQIINAYNVRVIEHKSPFLDQIQPIKSMSDLSSSIARLEQLSSDLSSLSTAVTPPTGTAVSKPEGTTSEIIAGNNTTTTTTQELLLDNNNEANFNLGQFMKQKPGPFKVYNSQNGNDNENENENGHYDDNDDDNVSLVSSCSLRSSTTYHIRRQDDGTLSSELRVNLDLDLDDLNDASDFPVESIEFVTNKQEEQKNTETSNHVDLESDEKKPKAWVFDLRDNSSTAIVAPARPKEPELPKVDAKTEELARSKGGRSYYLELIENEPRKKINENLYTRWSSQNAINTRKTSADSSLSSSLLTNQQQVNLRKSRQSMISANRQPNTSSGGGNKLTQATKTRSSSVNPKANDDRDKDDASNKSTESKQQDTIVRRQLPFSGIPLPQLGNRSKSVSCLASSTRPTKYSIYGGFKKPNADKKPVPRLSYSRAIGPKSQRQIDNQPKTPSRYLKMK